MMRVSSAWLFRLQVGKTDPLCPNIIPAHAVSSGRPEPVSDQDMHGRARCDQAKQTESKDVAIGSRGPGPFRVISFPIHEPAAVYKVKSPGQIKGMRKAAIDAIDAIEPYGGGAGHTLWQIHRLDNIDKHRLLLTVYGELLNHSLLPSQREQIIKGFLASHPGSPAPDLTGVYIAPGRRLPPLKEGDTLLTIPESEMEQYMNFSIGIAFGEPEVLQGNSVIPTLQGMAQFVELILRKFADLGLLS